MFLSGLRAVSNTGLFIVSSINSLTSIVVCGQGHFAVRPFIYYISRYYIYDNAYTMTNNLNIIDNSHIFLLSVPFLFFSLLFFFFFFFFWFLLFSLDRAGASDTPRYQFVRSPLFSESLPSSILDAILSSIVSLKISIKAARGKKKKKIKERKKREGRN